MKVKWHHYPEEKPEIGKSIWLYFLTAKTLSLWRAVQKADLTDLTPFMWAYMEWPDPPEEADAHP